MSFTKYHAGQGVDRRHKAYQFLDCLCRKADIAIPLNTRKFTDR